VLLSYLLSGAVLPELGRTTSLVSIEFQSGQTPTDDFLVTGTDTEERLIRCSIGARRNPLIQASNSDSVKLLRRFMETIEQERDLFEARDWWVCLAASVISVHAHELNELAAAARDSEDVTQFRERFAPSGRSSQKIRRRLVALDKIMELLVTGDEPLGWTGLSDDLSYGFLMHLRVRTLQLEGTDETSRVEAINRVIPMTVDGDGDRLFAQLLELASRYAIAGATVTEEHLRADLGVYIADDYLIAASGRRVGREPTIVRHIRQTRDMLNARRRVLRASLGLTEAQIHKSFENEGDLPAALLTPPRGRVLALRGPLGSGKSDLAIRWLLSSNADTSFPDRPLPVWIAADSMTGSLESEINALLGRDAVDRYSINIVIDGLDERIGNRALADAQAFAIAHQSVSVLVTTREGEPMTGNVEVHNVPLWSTAVAYDLVARIAGTEPSHVGHGWTDALSSAVRRPLFALIAGMHYEKLGTTPAALIAAAVESSVVGIESASELEKLAVAVVRANGAVDPRGLRVNTESLLKTRLVELTKNKLRFTLPIFEQWFAAQSILRGDVPVHEFADSVVGFAHWRYVLAIATTTGSRDLVDPIMHALVRSNPGAAAWVIREGMSTSIDDDATAGLWRDAGDSVLRAMKSWFAGLPPIASGLAPYNVTTGPLDDSAERLQLTFGTFGREVAYGWAERPSGEQPQLVEWTSKSRDGSFERSGWAQVSGENWLWTWTFDQIRDGLKPLLFSHQLLAQMKPAGVVDREFLVWLASTITRTPPLACPKVPISKIRDAIEALRKIQPDHTPESFINISGDQIQWSSIERLSATLDAESSDHLYINLYAGPDLPGDAASGRRLRYSPERLAERLAQVYEAAGVAYLEIVDSFLPKFGKLLAHAATFPAVISGSLSHDLGSGDLGGATIEFRWLDETAEEGTPVTARLTSVDELGWKVAQRRAWEDRTDSPDDPVRAAFGLFHMRTTTRVDYSLHKARPATSMALEWVAEDLHKLGWLKERVHRPIS
jgi:hypothetical protein